MAIITSDDLINAGRDRYQRIRRAATKGRQEGKYRYICAKCEHGVYAPREPHTKLPYWKHFKGAPITCPWWTGDPNSPDTVSARQFDGEQESPLHRRLKCAVAKVLESDPLTQPGSVQVDEYLVTESGKRRPDVRAIHNGWPIAFEVQLATTQIPIIVAREAFYEREGYRLVWLTWRFEPVPRARMLTAFEDIFYSHGKNILSVDPETLDKSGERNTLVLRAYWEGVDDWETGLFHLSELQWLPTGLAYAVSPPPPWHQDFRERWAKSMGTEPPTILRTLPFLYEIYERLHLPARTELEMIESGLDDVLNCISSFVEGRIIGSKQKNLAELINTFFAAERRARFARLIRKAALVSGNAELLERPSVRRKLEKALLYPQDGPDSEIGLIALALFPEIGRKVQ